MKRKLLFAMLCIVGALNSSAWDGSEGKVYLQNVGSGLWWGAGNNWGTRASLLEHPEYVTLHLADGKYTLESQVSNGGTAYYFNGDYMDNGSPVNLTITEVETGVYTIANDAKYYGYDGSTSVLGKEVDSSTDNGKWKIFTETEMLAKFASATAAAPVDATFLILDPNFGRNNRNTSVKKNDNISGAWTMKASNLNRAGTNENNCVESFHSTFDLVQTIATHPAGVYMLKAQGFYRQDGADNTNLPYFFLNDSKVTFPLKTGTENSMNDASNSFAAGNYVSDAVLLTVEENAGINVGAKLEVNTGLWCIWDNFVLTYYGTFANAKSLYTDKLAAAVAAAAAVDGTVPAAVYSTLNGVVTAKNQDYASASDFDAATAAIYEAIAEAQKFVAPYSAYLSMVTQATDAGVSSTVINAQNDAVAAATTLAEVENSTNTLIVAIVKLATDGKTGVDLTSFFENADFEKNSLAGWTSTDGGGVANNGNFNSTIFVERWQSSANGGLSNGSLTHDAVRLPAGLYLIQADAQNIEQYNENAGGTGLFLCANEEKTEIGAKGNYLVGVTLPTDGLLTIKFMLQDCTGNWVAYDNVTVTYYQQAADILDLAVAAADAALADDTYASVTGDERTGLESVKGAGAAGTELADYLEAANNIYSAIATFKAAAPSYDRYVAYLNETKELFGTDFSVAAPTTAATTTEAIAALNIAQYKKVADDYTYSLNGLIGDFGTWTSEATVAGAAGKANYLDWEHWSGQTHAYYEQDANGWGNANGWTIKYEKICRLPAGNYVLKVAARSSAGTTSKVSCSATPTVISLPSVGASGRGINTSGEASWSDDDTFANTGNFNDHPATVGGSGTGWQWRFLPFTLTEKTEVTMVFEAEASSIHQWMSIADGELLSATDVTVKKTYYEDKNNGIKDEDVADVEVFRNVYQGYNTVVLPFTLTANQVTETFGAGCEVYNFSENSDDAEKATINFKKGDGSINANVPVLVKVTKESGNQVFKGVKIEAPASEPVVEGKNIDFVGTYDPIKVAAGDYFIYQNNLYKSEGKTNMNAFRAYLKAKSAEVKAELFIDGVATSIEAINGTEKPQGAIYNLNGQRVQKAQKGLYIIGGKKVLVK